MNMTNKELIKRLKWAGCGSPPPNSGKKSLYWIAANALESADAQLEEAREIVRRSKKTIDMMNSWDQSEYEWEQLAELLGMEDE